MRMGVALRTPLEKSRELQRKVRHSSSRGLPARRFRSPDGDEKSIAQRRGYTLTVVSATARILAHCASVKATTIVKISAGLAERAEFIPLPSRLR